MTNRRTKFLMKLKGKKRYVLLPWLALELASLPAAAQVIHKVAFEVRPIVTAVEIPTDQLGKKRFLVTSNAPFSIESANMIGDLSISVHRSGEINGQRFGDNAQLPGQDLNCASIMTQAAVQTYQAHQKTAASNGSIISQAVVFEFSYDPSASPELEFIAGNSSKTLAANCSIADA